MLNHTPVKSRFYAQVKVGKEDECWEYLGSRKGKRYGAIRFDNRRIPIHQYSYFLYYGHLPLKGEYICHKCDNTFCLNPHHLFLGNQKDNMRDMVDKRRNSDTRGEKNPNCLLSKESVLKIRELRSLGWTYKRLQAEFHVGGTQIWRIIKRESWSWLK